ncbi:MAG: hypothetical protein JWR03_2193 [Cohnella sp.]|jgi:hypothetical protein|nr:hypothetical protein [Cohnella sp.]
MEQAKAGINDDDDSFLFRVEILVHGNTDGAALERLLRVLKEGGFTDYRIGSGIGRGRTIEEAVDRERKKRSTPAQPPAPAATAATPEDIEQRILRYISTNKLIRLNVNKGRGVRLNMPCRILNYDSDEQLITVYHEDEKQVHSFKLFEIEDFIE